MLWLTSPDCGADETGRVVALVVIWGWKAFGRPLEVVVEGCEESATAEVGWDRSGESTTVYVRELASKVPSPALTSDSLEEKDDSDSLMVEPEKKTDEKALHSGGPENIKKSPTKKNHDMKKFLINSQRAKKFKMVQAKNSWNKIN